MRTAIISTGDELIRGVIADTNGAWIASRLLELGSPPSMITVAGDDLSRLAGLITESLASFDLTIVGGGLGPTDDDLTASAAALATGRPLVRDDLAASQVRAAFDRIGRVMHGINLKQADLPEGARVLENPVGTAPGFLLAHGEGTAVFLPGVPSELREMFELHVPRLLPAAAPEHSAVFRCFGMGESDIQAALRPVTDELPGTRLAFRASFPEIGVTLFAPEARSLGLAAARIDSTLGPVVFSRAREGLPEALGNALAARGLTLATAESCTGGLIAHSVTRVPGSSGYFRGSVVAYDNAVKVSVLGVEPELLAARGAVSEEVARAMARGAAEALRADIGIATTGIAGPGGGTEKKPVGLVHIAVVHPRGETHRRCLFGAYNRGRGKTAAAWTAMRMAFDAAVEMK